MHESEYEFILEVNVVAASLCPCSREMSLLHNLNPIDDLELNANQGDNWDAMKALVGHRVGMGAHNQRSQIRVRVCPTPQSMIWIEDLIEVVEAAASAPTYPLLKRPDEKFVTELAYKNAKFSEDILRDLQIGVQAIPGVSEWSLRVCNEESIHPFDVTCIQNSDGWKH
jgi:GTP cyclohydrolase FolE2